MPKVSELVANGAASAHVWDIVVDCDDVTPPTGLKEAGILVEMDGDDVSDKVLDVAIAWAMAKVAVTLEVPADVVIPDEARLVSTVAAVGLSLSILPPSDLSDEAFKSWCDRVVRFAEAYVAQPNMSGFVFPVSSYHCYLIMEMLKPSMARNFKPVDPYIVDRFHARVPEDKSDELKARIRSTLVDAYGGEKDFEDFSCALVGALYRQIEEGCIEESQRLKAETQDEG